MSLVCVYGADVQVANWFIRASGEPVVPPYVAVGVVDRTGLLHGAIVYSDYNGHTIEMSVHFDGTVRERGVVREMFRYPFLTANVRALAARTRRSNTRVRSMLRRLGFREVGLRRRFFGEGRENDAILFDMLKAECRWLDENVKNADRGERELCDGQTDDAEQKRGVPDLRTQRHEPVEPLREPDLPADGHVG